MHACWPNGGRQHDATDAPIRELTSADPFATDYLSTITAVKEHRDFSHFIHAGCYCVCSDRSEIYYYQVHILSSQLFVISKTRIHYKNMLRVYKAISSKQIFAHNRPALRSFRVYFEGYRCPADTKIKG
jgi:hypothetical protein